MLCFDKDKSTFWLFGNESKVLQIIAPLMVLKCICLRRERASLGHRVKCFFNESEEFHLVDGHDGLCFHDLRDGKATIDADRMVCGMLLCQSP